MEQNIDKQRKNSKRNIKMMILIIVLFIIGIITRWEYVSTEISSSFKARFSHDSEQVDTTVTEDKTTIDTIKTIN